MRRVVIRAAHVLRGCIEARGGLRDAGWSTPDAYHAQRSRARDCVPARRVARGVVLLRDCAPRSTQSSKTPDTVMPPPHSRASCIGAGVGRVSVAQVAQLRQDRPSEGVAWPAF